MSTFTEQSCGIMLIRWIADFLGALANLWKATCHVCPSAWINSAPTGRIFMKFDIWEFFFENPLRTFKFHYNRTGITSTSHEDQLTFFLSYLAPFFLEWEMFHTKVVEKINTHILCSVPFFFSKIVPFMRNYGKILGTGTSHRWQYGAWALPAAYLGFTRRLCNTHCFSTTTMVARTPLIVT